MYAQESGDRLVFLCVEIDAHVGLHRVGIVLGSGIWGLRSGDAYFRKSLLE